MTPKLINFGFSEFFQQNYSKLNRPEWSPLRVISQAAGLYRLYSPIKERDYFGKVSGKIRWQVESGGDSQFELPVVGDWCCCELIEGSAPDMHLRIEALLPRRSSLKRKAPTDRGGSQIFAANIEEVWCVCSLDHDLSFERIDRMMSLILEGGAQPRIVLTKADLLDGARWDETLKKIADRFPGVPVSLTSIHDRYSIEELEKSLCPSHTIVIVGSSGVGKSSLVNALLGENRMATQAVRTEDSKGRHTTTHRELLRLKCDAMLIDTPGVREWQILSEHEAPGGFSDIEEVARNCRFGNCQHETEPGCAVREGLRTGLLQNERWLSYQKLSRELAHQNRKGNKELQSSQKKKWKKMHMDQRKRNKYS
jgi:ribosome biogenesis GTPase / thiamine phosphate phosphatase